MSPESTQTNLPRVIDALWKSLGFTSRSAFWEAAGITNKNYWNKRLAGKVLIAKKHIDQLVDGLRQAGYSITSEQEANLFSAIGITVTISRTPVLDEERKQERLARLSALLADHSEFIRDRLTSFVGREQELAEIRQLITEKFATGGYITITGQAGQGKSSIIAKLVDEYGADNVAHHFIPFNPGSDHQVELLQNLMVRLILKYDLPEFYVAHANRATLRGVFPNVLQEVSKRGRQEIIFIDGLDQIQEDSNGERDLSFLPSNPPSNIVIVLGTRPNDTLRPLQLLRPHYQYELPSFTRSDFSQILEHRRVIIGTTLADRFYIAMQKNVLYLDLVAQELATSSEISPEEIIRRVADDPNALFSFIIGSEGRLSRWSEWERVGLSILRFLYAAQQPLSEEALQYLIEAPLATVKRGVQKLGGLVVRDGNKRYYLYHLKLQIYLQRDMFSESEIVATHQRLAEWSIRGKGDFTTIWEDVPYNIVEQERHIYARQHYITHLYYAQDWERLWVLLDDGSYGHLKVAYDPSTLSYMQDLDLGRQAAARIEWRLDEGVALLSNLWRYSLLHCTLNDRATTSPSALFDALVQGGQDEDAFQLAQAIGDPVEHVSALNSIARLLGTEPAHAMLRDKILARALAVLYENNTPTILDQLRVHLVSILVWTNHIEQAHEMIADIDNPWFHIQALLTTAEALNDTGHIEQALKACNEAEPVIYEHLGTAERDQVYTALVRLLARLGQLDRADHIINDMEMRDSQGDAHWYIINELSIKGDITGAEARLHFLTGDFYARARALSDIASAYARSGQPEQARRVFQDARTLAEKMEQGPARDGTLRYIAEDMATVGQIDKAAEIAGSIRRPEKVRVLCCIAKAHAQAGRGDLAVALFNEAAQVAAMIIPSFEQHEAFMALAIALAQTGRITKAQEYASKTAVHLLKREDALTALAEALAHSAEIDEAQAVMVMIDNPARRRRASSAIGVALAQSGRAAEAEAIALSLVEVEPVHSPVVHALAIAAMRDGRVAVAKVLAQKISKPSARDRTWSAMVAVLAENGQWAEAGIITEMISEAVLRVEALCTLATARAKAMDIQAGRETLIVARQIASGISIGKGVISLLCRIALTFASFGDTEGVTTTFEEAIQQVERYRERNSDDLRLEIINAMAAVDHSDAIQAIVEQLTDDYCRVFALSVVAESKAATGHTVVAHTALQQAQVIATALASFYQARALCRVALAYDRIGDMAQSQTLARMAKVCAAKIQIDHGTSDKMETLAYVARTFAQLGQMEEAQTIADTLGTMRADVLRDVIEVGMTLGRHRDIVALVQRLWRAATTQNELLDLLEASAPFVAICPGLGLACANGMTWVDKWMGQISLPSISKDYDLSSDSQ